MLCTNTLLCSLPLNREPRPSLCELANKFSALPQPYYMVVTLSTELQQLRSSPSSAYLEKSVFRVCSCLLHRRLEPGGTILATAARQDNAEQRRRRDKYLYLHTTKRLAVLSVCASVHRHGIASLRSLFRLPMTPPRKFSAQHNSSEARDTCRKMTAAATAAAV